MLSLLFVALVGCDSEPERECAESALVTVYTDNDNDGHGVEGTAKQVCEVKRGFSVDAGDCDDTDSAVNPSAIEVCDGIDNDCDELADEGLREETFYLDADGDEYGDPDLDNATQACTAPPGFVDNSNDCDDDNAGINPMATEVCDGLIDNDCDGRADDNDTSLDLTTAPSWYLDNDGDTYGGTETVLVQCAQPGPGTVLNADDCDDDNADIFPGAGETCNGVDDDCDQLIDDSDPDLDPAELNTWFADFDGDGFGDPDSTTDTCFVPWFYVDNADDCDDTEPLLGLPAPWLQDGDGDGYGAGASSPDGCEPPTTGGPWVLEALGVDCDDSDIFTFPGAPEVCDAADNDCDGLFNENDPDLDLATATEYFRDNDGDTYGSPTISVFGCLNPPPGHVEDNTDCNDLRDDINPGQPEICNGIDDDCDLLADDDDPDVVLASQQTYYADFDDDGFGDPSLAQDACEPPAYYTDNDLDCDDTDPLQLVFGPWVEDVDQDGVGAGPQSPDSCTAPYPGWVPTYYGLDCDDGDPDRFPGNTEICNNGVDEDCDSFDPPCSPPPEAECGVSAVTRLDLDHLMPELDLDCASVPLAKVRLQPGETVDLEALGAAHDATVVVTERCADPELCPEYVGGPELTNESWSERELFLRLEGLDDDGDRDGR